MRISLDHDGTYSEDPVLWDAFIALAQSRGHEVVCVTMRHPHESVKMPIKVIYTCRQAKANHYQADVWIDDAPHWVYSDSH